jgi:hypothetical protein
MASHIPFDASSCQRTTPETEVSSEGTPKNVWLLLGTIGAAKLGTLVVILWASHSLGSVALIVVTIWPWFVVAGMLIAGPALFRYRLRRVRAKREQLWREEWTIDDVDLAPVATSTARPQRG